MAGLSTGSGGGGGSGGYYIQSTAPTDPGDGELWVDTSLTPPRVKVYDGGAASWKDEIIPDLSVGTPNLAADAVTGAKVGADEIGAGHIASGAVGSTQLDGTYPNSSIGGADLAFDAATQGELDNHAGDATAHHSRPTATANAGPLGGYETPNSQSSNLVDDDLGSYVNFGSGETATIQTGGTHDGIRLYFQDANGQSFAVYHPDGSTLASDSGMASDTWLEYTWAPSNGDLVIENTGVDYMWFAEADVHYVNMPQHNHPI